MDLPVKRDVSSAVYDKDGCCITFLPIYSHGSREGNKVLEEQMTQAMADVELTAHTHAFHALTSSPSYSHTASYTSSAVGT